MSEGLESAEREGGNGGRYRRARVRVAAKESAAEFWGENLMRSGLPEKYHSLQIPLVKL